MCDVDGELRPVLLVKPESTPANESPEAARLVQGFANDDPWYITQLMHYDIK